MKSLIAPPPRMDKQIFPGTFDHTQHYLIDNEIDLPFEKSTSAVEVAERLRVIDSAERHAVFATSSDGQPYTSLIAFAMTHDMTEVIFATPKNTAKYRNMLKNKRVALLIDTRSNTDVAYMSSEAVTIIGTARPVRRSRK